jgi:hypothetical protein
MPLPRNDPDEPERPPSPAAVRDVRAQELAETLEVTPADHTLEDHLGSLPSTRVTGGGIHSVHDGVHRDALRITPSSGLTLAFEGGRVSMDANVFDVAAGTIAVADDDTSYVEVNTSGVVVTNTTSFTTNFYALAEVTTAAGEVTAIVDKRAFQSKDSGAGGGAPDPHGSGSHNANSDAEAIHDNIASEISAVTEKATPVNADLVLIEDSADSNNKKRVQVGNLPRQREACDA